MSMLNASNPAVPADTPPANQASGKLLPWPRRAADPAKPKRTGWDLWLHRIYVTYGTGVFLCLAGSFIESFLNLVDYANRNGYVGILSVIAPLMVDIVTLGGEAVVLVATVLHWERRVKVAGWAATFLGLALSVAGNVGKNGWSVPGPDHSRRFIPVEHIVAFSVPPVAMAGMLALSLMIIKRLWRTPGYPALPEGYPALTEDQMTALHYWPEVLSGGEAPGVPTIRKTVKCGQPRAQGIRDYLAAVKADLDRYAASAGDSGEQP